MAIPEILFANNASTTLAVGLNTTATVIIVAAGTGALFPHPVPGQGFYATITDAETQTVREIVQCGTITGDAIPVIRAQQETTALAWNAGDVFAQLNTAGDMQNMVQPSILQRNKWGKASAVGGTVNNITATVPSDLTALPDGMVFIVFATGANTAAVNLTLTLGATLLASAPIQKYGSSGLNAGDIPEAGFAMQLVWGATLGAFLLMNPGTGVAGSIAGGAANEVLVQTGAGTTGFIAAPTVAGSVLAWTGSALAWLAAAVTSFNGRGGAVMPAGSGEDYTAAMVEAIPDTAFQAPNVSGIGANPGFFCLPDGAGGISWVHQAGNRSIPANTPTSVAFGKIFPHGCKAVVVSCNNQSSAIRVDTITAAGFVVDTNATAITWIADGD